MVLTEGPRLGSRTRAPFVPPVPKGTIDLASVGLCPDVSLESAQYHLLVGVHTVRQPLGDSKGSRQQRGGAMTHSENGGAADAAEPQVPSRETKARTDIDSSPNINGHDHEGSAESELSLESPSDAVAKIVLQAEQLAQGIREVAGREAKRQTSEILAKAEIKAREQILEPAAAQAASKSQEIMARAEQEAEAILSGVKRLFARDSDAGHASDSSSVDGPEAAAHGTTSEGLRKRPPTISPAQRDQLKEVIAKRASEL